MSSETMEILGRILQERGTRLFAQDMWEAIRLEKLERPEFVNLLEWALEQAWQDGAYQGRKQSEDELTEDTE